MKKLLVGALLAFAIPAFAHADDAKPADKSAKKAGGKDAKKDGKKDGEEKKDDAAAGEKK